MNGELSQEDFSTLKEEIEKERKEVESLMNALDAETSTMEKLLEETQKNIVNLVKAWRTGTVQQRQELAFSLYPGGLIFSEETHYFESRNTLIMNAMHEMMANILAGKDIGAGDGI